MVKTIIIKLKRAGSRTNLFSITDSNGEVLVPSISKQNLISGIPITINDNVYFVIISTIGSMCNESIKIPITTVTHQQLADIKFKPFNTGSVWRHITTTTLYNNFYGVINPYVIEYPFAYQYQDEILQNIKDYTKSYIYLTSVNGTFNVNRKIQVNDRYFNKAVLYNDQQSSGLLELVNKPLHNLKSYMSYPKYNIDSKSILYTNSDNFYQYNTFWSIVKDKFVPLFVQSCQSLSIDKEINQENMTYTNTAFKKAPLRAKDLKVRMMLDNASDIHLVSQFLTSSSQISYK